MLIYDEYGRAYAEEPDGTLVPLVYPERPAPPPRRVVEVDLTLPEWFERSRQEGLKIRHTLRSLMTEYMGRKAAEMWFEELTGYRGEIRARLAVIDRIPRDADVRIAGVDTSGPGYSNGHASRAIRKFIQSTYQWLIDTSHPDIYAAELNYNLEWNNLTTHRHDVFHSQYFVNSIYSNDRVKAMRRAAKTAKGHDGDIKALQLAEQACSPLKASHITLQDVADGLSQIRANITDDSRKATSSLWWDYITKELATRSVNPTFDDYQAGREVLPWQRERFEYSTRPDWDGLWPNER